MQSPVHALQVAGCGLSAAELFSARYFLKLRRGGSSEISTSACNLTRRAVAPSCGCQGKPGSEAPKLPFGKRRPAGGHFPAAPSHPLPPSRRARARGGSGFKVCKCWAFRFKSASDLRNHRAIAQPRLYDSAVATQITLKTEGPHGLPSGRRTEVDPLYPGLIILTVCDCGHALQSLERSEPCANAAPR